MFTIDRSVWQGTSQAIKPPKAGHLLYREVEGVYGYREQTVRKLVCARRVKGGDGYVNVQSLKDYITGRS